MAETTSDMTDQSSAARDMTEKSIMVKRCWGLGNVLCLLPVLDKLCEKGADVTAITQDKWVPTMSRLRPNIRWHSELSDDAVDLDTATQNIPPSEHRTDEFGRLLKVA